MPFPKKEFPSTADLARIANEDDYYNLYTCNVYDHDGVTDRGAFRLKEFFENDKKKSQLLAIAFNVAPLVADAGTDFLFGEEAKIEAEEEKIQEQIDEIMDRNELLDKLDESSTLFQTQGHAHFKVFRDSDGKAVVEEIPYDQWFPNWSGVTAGSETTNPRIVAYLEQVDESNVKKGYVYIEDYYLVPREKGKKECVIEYSLWEEKSGRKIGDQVPLSLLGLMPENAEMVKIPTEGDEEEESLTAIQHTGMSRIPIVSIHHRKTVKERYGFSIYKRVQPLLEELNDRITQVSIQFLKHLDPKMQLPETAVVRDQKTGQVKRVNLEVILAKQGDPDAKYITNENPQIEAAFKHIERILRSIAKLTQTPDSFLMEDEKGGVEKVESLRARLMSFLKRIRRYQRKYDKAIKKILSLAIEAENKKQPEDLNLNITFDVGLPKDWRHDEEVWGAAYDRGTASRRTAIARFQGIEGDELDSEIKEIEDEEKKMPKFDMDKDTDKEKEVDDDTDEE